MNLGYFLNEALDNITEMGKRQRDWQKKIANEWDETKKLPRKKKKQRRKELLLDWRIACWNPFDILN